MGLFRIFLHFIAIVVLTVLTQVGGIIYLGMLFVFARISFNSNRTARFFLKVVAFVVVYVCMTFLIVPFIAPFFGRVPLPVQESGGLAPGNLLTCVLNRHYVRPELRRVAQSVASKMQRAHPGSRVNYLDANFPFIDQFPLLPHRSHDDGRKLDLSFQYDETFSGRPTNRIPSFFGYGICEEPKRGEPQTARYCKANGYWQYDIIRQLVPQGSKREFRFNEGRTTAMLNWFISHQEIGRVFLEPHLKQRLQLKSAKVKFHGCNAVRHDDHIHVQLK